MTDDWRQDFQLNPWSTPRAYSYFKVKFTVFNKLTDEHNSIYYYVSCKRSQKWLESIIPTCVAYPLPREYFEYTYEVQEVEDSDDILFHHVTTKESWERVTVQYFLMACALGRWKVSYWKKIQKFFKKIRLFVFNRLFISVTTIKV